MLKSLREKGMLRQTLQDLQADLFLGFEDDLERIRSIYEEEKESPPISHNAPTVASALLWIRQLIHQIEEPMKVFRENKALMSNKVCKLRPLFQPRNQVFPRYQVPIHY